MNGTNGNEPGYPEKALVPYPVILAATSVDLLSRPTGRMSRVWGRHSPTRFTKGGKTADMRILAPW